MSGAVGSTVNVSSNAGVEPAQSRLGLPEQTQWAVFGCTVICDSDRKETRGPEDM